MDAELVSTTTAAPARPGFVARWWIYQRERFPVLANGVLIAAFSYCAVAFSLMLRGEAGLPGWRSVLVAFASCLIFFLQLRIADEFKDSEEDARYRPYRPVPRGLVTLRELAVVFAIGAAAQLALALWLEPRLALLLLGAWAYLTAMTKEFFVRRHLKGRPVVYMVSHMVIMPIIDLYATSSDWLTAGETRPPLGLVWFLLASFFNGMVIEIGRKIRSRPDEEHGVETYSALWGRGAAVGCWWGVTAAALVCAALAAARIDWLGPALVLLGVSAAGALAVGIAFLRNPAAGRGAWIERYAGVWTLTLYLSLGAAPLLWRTLA